MRPNPDDPARLRAELEAIPKSQRMTYLADLPPARQAAFKRLLSPADIKKLNAHIDGRLKQAATPTHAKWIAEARAGRATSPDAMIEVLRENAARLRPQDAQWIDRIVAGAAGRSFSAKQEGVIRAIYARYYDQRGT